MKNASNIVLKFCEFILFYFYISMRTYFKKKKTNSIYCPTELVFHGIMVSTETRTIHHVDLLLGREKRQSYKAD